MSNTQINKNKKGDNTIKKIITIMFTFILAITFISCNENDGSIKRKEDSRNYVKQNSSSSNLEPKEEQPMLEITAFDWGVSGGKYEISTRVQIVEYVFTHRYSIPLSFNDLIYDIVYQGGIECPRANIIVRDVDTQKIYNKVQPNVEYSVKVGYLLNDDYKEITVECYDIIGGSPYKLVMRNSIMPTFN